MPAGKSREGAHESHPSEAEELVPEDVIPPGRLPPLRRRDLPEPVPWKRMIGPSVLLAGLALGSGEFILWPYITYKAGFIFFWACVLGVVTQFFLNTEIERWTLLTGESAIAGFCRLSKQWAWIMLILNVLPSVWPGWATGAGTLLSWMVFGTSEEVLADGSITYAARYVPHFGIAGLFLVGVVLTAGPVVYNTVERIQLVLVGLILVMVVALSFLVVRPDAWAALASGTAGIGRMPDLDATGLSLVALLGALAFAGAGGTTNLGQSDFIKDKGYGMGRYIGRITSPITGREEATSEVGYHFAHTPENMERWRRWWRAANVEHFFSFLLTCLLCLALLSLISYSLFYDSTGTLKPGMGRFGEGMDFVWGEATILRGMPMGRALETCFLAMGIVILLTTELGILDVVSRISADIVKTNYLRDSATWTASRLYFCFLWGEILIGSAILMVPNLDEPLLLLVISAAMQGGVMFIYSLLLLYMNNKVLPRRLSMSPVRFLAIVWSCAFFGYFTAQALRHKVLPTLFGS